MSRAVGTRAAAPGDDRVELEAVEAEQSVGGARDGAADERLGEQARRRADAGLREGRLALVAGREVARRDQRDHVGLRQPRLAAQSWRSAARAGRVIPTMTR